MRRTIDQSPIRDGFRFILTLRADFLSKALSHRDFRDAIQDANLLFPEAANSFSDALGFQITEADTPHLYLLLRRSLTDAGLSTYTAKNHYQRMRPFMVNKEPTCTPDEESHLMKDGSHFARTWR